MLYFLIPSEAGEIQGTECDDGNAYCAAGLGWEEHCLCQELCTSEEKSHHEPHSCRFPSFGTLKTFQLGAPISSGKHFQFQRCKIAQIRLIGQI